MSKHDTIATAATLLGVPLMFAALTACGTDGAADDEKPTGADASQSFATFEEYQLAFAECMRGQGIEMDDPDDGGVQIQADDDFMAAADTCQSELGTPPAQPDSGGQDSDEDTRTEHLAIAECLRENGVDVSDPGPGEYFEFPPDAPVDVIELCAPDGIGGSTGGGQ